MNGNSQPVRSRQRFCHPALGRTVARHMASRNLRPPAPHTLQAFEAIRPEVESQCRPLVFDSFCGTGLSTGLLAQRHPDCLVIGIDKSAHRLERHQSSGASNYLLVRADCDDFWRLAADAGWRLQHHYLLYPNPWPKPGQFKRRVHGSAAFVDLLKLGGALELRSNWQVYVEEFGCALFLAGRLPRVDRLPPDVSLSLFETKYRQSGHLLWRCHSEPGQLEPPATAAQA
jgi:tRNA (guanine-N7-)-methyltransferase